MNRYLEADIVADLKKKMVFLGGPRQVGKTTLAKRIGAKYYADQFDYFNWDYHADRERVLKTRFAKSAKLLIFDEIHKYNDWKNYLKGIFDKFKDQYHILVTGSARLDLYQKGGDSMMGRYYYYRLHPFSYAELNETCGSVNLDKLLEFGGFPEPYFQANEADRLRWQNNRRRRLVKEDIRDINLIAEIGKLELFTDALPEKVGSVFSLNSLREDLKIAHKTATSWLAILENFYYVYRIYPYSRNALKSVSKRPKLYLWDWAAISDPGARFENLIVSHLYKWCHLQHDRSGKDYKLCYWRDNDKREIDLLLMEGQKIEMAIEIKSKQKSISKHLFYFKDRFPAEQYVQLINSDETADYLESGIRIVDAKTFLSDFS